MSECLVQPACCNSREENVAGAPPGGSWSFKGAKQGDWKEIRHTTVEYVYVGQGSGDYTQAPVKSVPTATWIILPLACCLALVFCVVLATRHGHVAKDVADVRAVPVVAKDVDVNPCQDLPFMMLQKVITSNLGETGPDTNASEGIVYSATEHGTGLNVSNLEIHVHSLVDFRKPTSHDNEDLDYHPAFTTGEYQDGLHGQFAAINIQQGQNLKVRVHAFDADKQEDVPIPNAFITFFDFDTGPYSVEFLKIRGFKQYFLTNETEIEVSNKTVDNVSFTVFKATQEGTGDDNPTAPLELSVAQKNKAVTLELNGNTSSIEFEIGATKGQTGRVFEFVLRPSLLCAKTEINGTLLPGISALAPIQVVPTWP